MKKTYWAGILLLANALMPAHSQTLEDLKADHATPGDILTYGMGYNNQRYSPLKQITDCP